MTQSLEDMLVNFFKTGKLGWQNFAQTIIDTLIRSQVQQLIAKTFGGINGGGNIGSGKGLLGMGGVLGFLADGGPASAGNPYIIGERGPELFVPNQSGTVIPNNAMGGSNVVYNINAVDAMSFKQMLAKDPAFLYSVTQMGARTMPGRA